MHSMGSHFACDLPSSIIQLQQELFHWCYYSSTAASERLWKSSSLTSLMCPIKELITTFPVRAVLFYSHKHLHLSVSVKAAKCCKRCGKHWKSRGVELGSTLRTKQNISPVCLTCQHVFWLLKKALTGTTFQSLQVAHRRGGWSSRTHTHTHTHTLEQTKQISRSQSLHIPGRLSTVLCLALPLQVTFHEGPDRTFLTLSYVSIAFSRTMFWFKHHDFHHVRIIFTLKWTISCKSSSTIMITAS